MKNKSKLVLRRLAFVNVFDRACNMILSHISPLAGHTSVEISRLNDILSQDKYELGEEKKSLKALRRLVSSGETPESDMTLMLSAMESMQKVRHMKIQNMVKGIKVR